MPSASAVAPPTAYGPLPAPGSCNAWTSPESVFPFLACRRHSILALYYAGNKVGQASRSTRKRSRSARRRFLATTRSSAHSP
jgi:hypothetical protein